MRVLTGGDRKVEAVLLDSMHVDRRRVFVDWMGWDVPVVDGREMDSYDGADAVYLVVPDPSTGRHRASVRLLRTDRDHILTDHFAHLCDGEVPRGPRIREITRMCVSPDCPPEERTAARRALATGLVRYALATGLEAYTAVTHVDFLSRVLAAGWRCRPLGMPVGSGRDAVGALMIEIDGATAGELRWTGAMSDAGELQMRAVAA